MYISYEGIKKKLDNAEIERLKSVNENVAAQLKRGETPEQFSHEMPITITTVTTVPAKNPEIIYIQKRNEALNENESIVRINSFIPINNIIYKISSYNYVAETHDIFTGMMNAVIWKVFLIVLTVVITTRILSRYLLKSFRHTITAIKHFNLQEKEKLQFTHTSTKEFKELNKFLQVMTDKAIEDYSLVKEFSENASHELQTPLAVIQSKIELLSETDINGNQAALISDVQNAIDKLGRINYSLILLTKLDNHEFQTNQAVQFGSITNHAITAFLDRIILKNINITTSIDENVEIKIHRTLAEILVNNLLTNAIRHNIEGGFIDVRLTQHYLQINNTGIDPEMPTEELFRRFKKSNQCANSIGLGLSIVQQICKVSSFNVYYDFYEGWHSLTVYFNKNEKHRRFVPLQNYFKI